MARFHSARIHVASTIHVAVPLQEPQPAPPESRMRSDSAEDRWLRPQGPSASSALRDRSIVLANGWPGCRAMFGTLLSDCQDKLACGRNMTDSLYIFEYLYDTPASAALYLENE